MSVRVRVLIVILIAFITEAKAQKFPYTMQADVSLLVADGVIPVFGGQIFNGVKFDKWPIEAGITIGADVYRQFTLLPVSGSLKWLPFPVSPVTPYVSLSGGYGLAWLQRGTAEKNYKGGGVFNAMLGLRIKTKSRACFNVGAGFKQQTAAIIETGMDDLGRPVWESSEKYKFNRVVLSFGVSL